MLGVDRERLWRKLLAFDHGAASDADAAPEAAGGVDALVAGVQAAARGGNGAAPLRRMLVQRVGYWLRADVAPAFRRFFRDAAPLLAAAPAQSARQRRMLALFCAEQLTLALQLAEEAFAHCVQIASLFDGGDGGSGEGLGLVGHAGCELRVLARADRSMLEELRLHFRCIMFEDFEMAEVQRSRFLLHCA